ncbi:MAG: hypothetical protein OEZ19_01275 [Paracoccaceae bacterium]|nr:hypothetical protein [Paracoccaceae bacterium]
MTALKDFERLEATGLWRATADAQRVDVIISLGDATLILTDQKDVALAHWSLAALIRLNPGELPAVFAPGEDAQELLEISDETLLEAIARIQAAIERRRPHPGRLRFGLVATIAVVLFALTVFWLPNAMINYTAAVVPPLKRAAIGQALLENMQRLSGSPCNVASGERVLRKLHARLFPEQTGRIVVLGTGVATTQHLPGGILLVNRAIVEDYEGPNVLAGYLLAEALRVNGRDPLVRLLKDAGIGTAFRLLTTGDVSTEVLAAHAEGLLVKEPSAIDEEDLLTRFGAAAVRATPYAYAIDISGETTVGLIEADPVPVAAAPLLSDGDWVALQEICGE